MAVVLQALVTPLLDWQTPHPTGRVVGSIIVLGVFSTGLAYVLYFRLIASAVNYVVPIVAVLIGVVFLDEPVTWNVIAGGLVVLAGMAYAENRAAARVPSRSLDSPGR